MTKQLYEEALADVKKVKEVAEADAKRAIIEAVTPRIRDLIERELLQEHSDLAEDELMSPGFAPGVVDASTEVMPGFNEPEAAAITMPDEEGKVTLDLDALVCPQPGVGVGSPMFGEPLPSEEYEINLESVLALAPVIHARNNSVKQFEQNITTISESLVALRGASKAVRQTESYTTKIAQMISRVEDMYVYVQESVTDPAKKSSYDNKLENLFKDLNKLQEQTMLKQNKKRMNEADVNLKLTGLPEDIDLDSVGVDLVTGEDDENGDGTAPEGGDDTSGDDSGLDGLDLGGDDAAPAKGMGEGLTDDTVVEIDEGMLRREIARMRRLREEAAPSTAGNGVNAEVMHDFGGGCDDGDPVLDHEPTTAGKVGEPLGESDDMDEGDQMDEVDDAMDEGDQMDEYQNRRKEDEYGDAVANGHETPKHEALQRRAAFESRLQERAKARASQIKKAVASARSKRDLKKESVLKKEYAQVARRFNESLDRSKKLTKLVAEAKKLHSESRRNGGSTRPAEKSAVESSLRKKLAETNLFNAKLLYTNKLLQNESMTARQKSQVIEQLEEAKTLAEVKLVYESLAKLAGNSRPVNESRNHKVIGSSSRTTRPASTQTLNEGFESDRWAKLAGIVK